MKRTISMFLALVFTASVCSIAIADEGWGDKDKGMSMEQMHKKKLDKMTTDLNLTPDQQTKIADIMKVSGEKMQAAKKRKEEEMKAMKDDYNSQVKAVLTPDQATKYDAMMAEHKASMEKKKGMMKKKMMKEEAATTAPAAK